MEEDLEKKLKELESRRKTLALGELEFKEGEKILDQEEKSIRKEMSLQEKEVAENKKIGQMEQKWNSLFGAVRENPAAAAFYVIAVVAIILMAIYLRTTMLKFWGFYEPDDFYHFSVIRAALNNGFIIPENLSISGWPVSTIITEPHGLYWVTLLPYFFLRFAGISYYNVMRYISVVFGLLDILGAYLLARFISKDKFFLLLVIALVALSSGDAARTSALIYRGDGFVTIFLILSLVSFIYLFKSKTTKERILFALAAAISLSLANFVWNGAPFVTLIFLLSSLIMMLYSFVGGKVESLKTSGYLILSLLVWYLLVNLMMFTGQIHPGSQVLTSSSFILVLAMFSIGWLVSYYLITNDFLKTTSSRSAFAFFIALLSFVALYVFVPNTVNNIIINNGVIVTNSFSATIQELTPPTYNFLFASFGYMLYSSPMSILMTMPAVLFQNVSPQSFMRTALDMIIWFFMILCFIPYFFMKVYDTKGFLGGNARVRFGADVTMIVLSVYFATTGFLQIYAIRFNSLVAVPLAIFGAYTIYWLILYVKNLEISRLAGPVALFAVSTILLYSIVSSTYGNSPEMLILIAALSGIFAYGAYKLEGLYGNRMLSSFAIVAILLFTVSYFDIISSSAVYPADSMNPSLYSAMGWLKNNSATNSVVLTLWPDGSVVEGVANRTSVMDSVGSQNAQKSDIFAAWLFNSSSDPGFIANKLISNPNYLVVRYVWLLGESVGIFQESGLNTSTEAQYAFAPLLRFNETANATQETLIFSNGQPGTGAINAVTEIRRNNSVISYLEEGPGRISPFSYIAFSNMNTGNYSIVPQTAFNVTNHQTLLIQYSDVPNPNFPLNVTSAIILAPGIAQSNMVKFLYFCGISSCIWNNNYASLKLVYANTDTKIFRIVYNSTS